jgi:hypothetical protein
MKLSPIQLLESSIEKILVERVRGDVSKEEGEMSNTLDFQVFKEIKPLPGFWEQPPEPADLKERTFMVTLGIRTPATKSFHNYGFELVVSGVLVSLREEYRSHSVQDMVLEYGLTLLYGIAREQFTATTARMSNGPCVLPTMSFIGEISSSNKTDATLSNTSSI